MRSGPRATSRTTLAALRQVDVQLDRSQNGQIGPTDLARLARRDRAALLRVRRPDRCTAFFGLLAPGAN